MEFSFQPVGEVSRREKYRSETPRQGVFSGGGARIVIRDRAFWREASRDLAGFERLWIIGVFHLNCDCPPRPLVHPPAAPERRGYGVFATRSPHRPNPLALSCVKLIGIDPGGLTVSECDLLDGTPVLDIKPYIPEADAFPNAGCGWRETAAEEFAVVMTPDAALESEFLLKNGGPDFAQIAAAQLRYEPLNRRRKRVTPASDGDWVLSWRTWRMVFSCDEAARRIVIRRIGSGYSGEELRDGAEDVYHDKALHRMFVKHFGSRD